MRNFKKAQYESSLAVAAENSKGEPSWVIDQVLRQKREELARKWEEREQRLEKIRIREKQMEERASKRRRLEDADLHRSPSGVDEEAEFLLDGGPEDAVGGDDPLSSLSKETRALMEKVGLAGNKRRGGEEEDEGDGQDEVKVEFSLSVCVYL